MKQEHFNLPDNPEIDEFEMQKQKKFKRMKAQTVKQVMDDTDDIK